MVAPAVLAAGGALALLGVGLAVRRVGRFVDEEQMPLIALLAAGIFASQLLNFPIIGGTTGHLVGAALAVILLGPATSVVIFTVILVIQGFLFGDGGVLALGLNILNMGIVGSLVAWVSYRALRRRNETVAILVASWASVFLAAILAGVELGASYVLSDGSYGIPPLVAISSMALYHAFIGVGEAIITVGVLTYLHRVAPDVLATKKIRFLGAPE
jgi:cobalt/nickel transport system permease protein